MGQFLEPWAIRPSIQVWWYQAPQQPGENNGTPPLAWAVAKQMEHVLEFILLLGGGLTRTGLVLD
jgi:hypothetical protein